MANRATAERLGDAAEADALRRIAKLLGSAEDWDDAASFLEEIAVIISDTAGLPNPGAYSSTAFYRSLRI